MATRSSSSYKKRHTKQRSMPPHLPTPASRQFFSSRRRILMMTIPLALFSAAIFLFFMPFNGSGRSSDSSLGLLSTINEIEVVAEFPHDPNAFTQGLLYAGDDTLFESTGLYGQSSVRKVSLQTGKVEVIEKMGDKYFGEGLTLLGESLFQVAWLTTTGFSYDLSNLTKVKPFKHHMKDGWGLATDGQVLFGSDGTSTLYRMDPRTMKVTDKHVIKYNGIEVRYLNELEYINNEVWANVWQSDCIARISPKDGSLLGWILLPELRLVLSLLTCSICVGYKPLCYRIDHSSFFFLRRQGLLHSGHGRIDVLNGIAWDSEKKRLFVTGKLWPKLYEIKLKPAAAKSERQIARQCLV
ncbi:glutaminyl-peptide cyclotransferase-like isoform X1 [Brassica napus]|uniref:glutaminyl-peptide cyclotransferase-like isoform X1 n=1 Tax=Brassica napus TaxID=3708 RepID=UPI002078F02E|nr:glutaminyl-peptide cyclotransferase-like isoform X1 [Brassica napus]